MAEITMLEAINMALARALEDDPHVVVLGEDVGANGGVFRATDGLLQAFRRGPRAGYAAGRDRHCRHVRWIGRAGLSSGRGIPVPGLHLSVRWISWLTTARGCATARAAGSSARWSSALRRAPASTRPNTIPKAPRRCSRTYPGHSRGDPVLAGARLWAVAVAIHDPDPVVFLEPTRLYRAAEGRGR